jgi:hypothetical protein
MEGMRRKMNTSRKRGRREEWSRKEGGRKEISKGIRKKEGRENGMNE